MNANFELLPAVDISAGQSIRLQQGEAASSSSHGDPSETIQSFIHQGASWIHLVDLDQAFGRGSNQELISKLVRSNSETKFQVSGGVADAVSLGRALDSGAVRVNISSLALADLDWLEEIDKSKLTFGLDVKDGLVIPRGYKQSMGRLSEVLALVLQLGFTKLVVTDSERDGMLAGPNLELLRSVYLETGLQVIASGGISALEDLSQLLEIEGVTGAILGKALYVGNFTYADAAKLVG